MRRRRILRRRAFFSRGPDFSWHAGRYDRLKSHGFPIHGSVDGNSRRVLWLKVGKNNPNVIARYYLQAVERLMDAPGYAEQRKTKFDCFRNSVFFRNGNYYLSGEKTQSWRARGHLGGLISSRK